MEKNSPKVWQKIGLAVYAVIGLMSLWYSLMFLQNISVIASEENKTYFINYLLENLSLVIASLFIIIGSILMFTGRDKGRNILFFGSIYFFLYVLALESVLLINMKEDSFLSEIVPVFVTVLFVCMLCSGIVLARLFKRYAQTLKSEKKHIIIFMLIIAWSITNLYLVFYPGFSSK